MRARSRRTTALGQWIMYHRIGLVQETACGERLDVYTESEQHYQRPLRIIRSFGLLFFIERTTTARKMAP
jgi:hypothetical protein